MMLLRLFESSNPFLQVAERRIGEGALTIGRDPDAGWPLADPHDTLSRHHCTISLLNGQVSITDHSTNGIGIGPDRQAPARGEPAPLRVGDQIHLGHYFILVDVAPVEAAEPAQIAPPPVRSSASVTDAELLAHFCQGAGLEASAFAGQDAADLMRRLGAVYRQTIDDLTDLMRDRAMSRDDLNLDRTTISYRDNNPLKWAPAQRVAVDLLQESETGFLRAEDAVRASFADLRRHGECLSAGSRAAIRYLLETTRPESLEASTKAPGLGFGSRHEAVWKRYRELHASLTGDADRSGAIEKAFRAGYQDHLTAAAKRAG
jgi:predicted component of type VI protein secretion system